MLQIDTNIYGVIIYEGNYMANISIINRKNKHIIQSIFPLYVTNNIDPSLIRFNRGKYKKWIFT
jgi:hypothetical protein